MANCVKCGVLLPENANFCSNCGTPTATTASAPTPSKTGFEVISVDRRLQEHWIKRLVAFIIDTVIVVIVAFILAAIFFIPALLTRGFPPFFTFEIFVGFPILSGVIYVLYFTFADAYYGQTFGKRIMGFKVQTVGSQPVTLDKSFIRNVSKVYWVLLLVDIVVGLATPGDVRQKYSDRIAGTTVVEA